VALKNKNDLIFADEAIKILELKKEFKDPMAKLKTICRTSGLNMTKVGKHNQYMLSESEVRKLKKDNPDIFKKGKEKKPPCGEKPSCDDKKMAATEDMLGKLVNLAQDTHSSISSMSGAIRNIQKSVCRQANVPYPYSTDMMRAMDIIEAHAIHSGAKAARVYASQVADFEAENSLRIRDLMNDLPSEDRIYAPLMVIDEYGSAHDFLTIVRRNLLTP